MQDRQLLSAFPLQKQAYYKREDIASQGESTFLLEVTSSDKGDKNFSNKYGSFYIYTFP